MGDKVDLILEEIRVARIRFLAGEQGPPIITVPPSAFPTELPAPVRLATETSRGRLLNAAALILLELERLD